MLINNQNLFNCLSLTSLILLINCVQLVLSSFHASAKDPREDLISHCIPSDSTSLSKVIRVIDAEGESSILLKSSGSAKQLTECVTVIQSSPGFGLIVHPVSLKLTSENLIITVYQLHLAAKSSKQIFKWFGHVSFDSKDQHQAEPVICDLKSQDTVSTILVTFEPISSNVSWKSVDLQLLITSFLPNKDPLSTCPGSFYFDCGSGQCIRQSLHCDGIANCQNGIDEHGCSLSVHEIFFIVIAIIIMLSIVIGLIWYARRREINEDQQLSQSKINKSSNAVTSL